LQIRHLPGRKLIVNADDLGLHADIDRGIEIAHREGILTSASISAVGASFDHAVDLCRRCPRLDVGVHLTLVGERPLTDAAALGDLVTPEGWFVERYPALVSRVLALRLRREALRLELEAQVERVERTGIRPSHIDGHQHVHLLPSIWPCVVEIALEHDIPWVRMPAFRPLGVGEGTPTDVALRLGLNLLRVGRRLSLGRLKSADVTPALARSGHLTAPRIARELALVPRDAIAELVVHPGVTTAALQERYDWGYDWSGETTALTDPGLRDAIAAGGFELHRFADMAA
jgi:predicted glycoside hydrolase/deacetylase ChbG (UPF0249 family)